MGEIIELIYENGVFKPLKKVNLKSGEIIYAEIKKPKVVTKNFRKKLQELRKKVKKTENAHKILEEIRDDRC